MSLEEMDAIWNEAKKKRTVRPMSNIDLNAIIER